MGKAAKGKKGTPSIDVMKASFRNARDNGDKEEEARWANQIGHAFKDRGEYVTALKWFRKDYEISSSGSRPLDPVKLMPTTQSIGEVYLRLQNYDDALTYQHKHFHWAEQAGDLVEQQRASTQLGRTYLELYEIKDRLSALTDAKAYFQTSLGLARRLRTNLPANHACPSGFVIEQVDAYNNLGLARALAEDYKQALQFYSAGLNLCDEEEVDANDAARSRIHHNLGRLFAELREWDKAKYHTELDIEICQKIPHAQGEGKGLMNLADLYFKSQDYEQTTRCYRRALHIVQTLEDEDALVSQIKSNIEIVGQARAKSKVFDVDMQKLSKLRREVESSKGTAAERKYIKQECALLLELTGRAEELQAWEVHLGLAKRLKRLTTGLGDVEKLGDALEVVASSYYSLRNFDKAMKWHLKSFALCKRIGHLEGQIVAKINYGNALDASGNSSAALTAYQEGFEAATQGGGAKMLQQKISSLNNIHYCYFIRLERLDDARKVELQLKQLKYAREALEDPDNNDADERCSETASEVSSEDSPMASASNFESDEHSPAERDRVSNVLFRRSKVVSTSDESEEDNAQLSSINSLIRNRRRSQKATPKHIERESAPRPVLKRPRVQEKCHTQEKQNSGSSAENRRKRMVSDQERGEDSWEIDMGLRQARKSAKQRPVVEENDSAIHFGEMDDIGPKRTGRSSARHDAAEHVVNSDEEDMPIFSRKKRKLVNSCAWTHDLRSPLDDLEDASPCGNDVTAADSYTKVGNVSYPEHGSIHSEGLPTEIFPLGSSVPNLARAKSNEAVSMQANISGPKDKQSFGRVATSPSVAGYSCDLNPEGTTIPSTSNQGWTNLSLLDSYVNNCVTAALYVSPNSLLVQKLHSQKVSEEVVIAGCNLQDSDARPLLAALGESDAFSLLDMSHNLLGNATVHAIQELIKSTNQADLGLTLDLHCNKLGAGALLEICRCPVSLSRLEVLNLAGNRLTDAAARHVSKILKESQALASLNLESCALTTRAITQLTSALHPESPLNKLCIGNNSPIASHAIQELIRQLSKLAWFSCLDLRGLDLDGAAVACLCSFLVKSNKLTTLILQNTEIRNDGARAIANALSNPSHCLEQLDLSLNSFNEDSAVKLCTRVMSLRSLSHLNLSGNVLGEEAATALVQGLARADCRLKALDLSKCHLGQSSVIRIMQSLTDQSTLLDLNLAENVTSLQIQLPAPEDSVSPHLRADIIEREADNLSLKKSSMKSTDGQQPEEHGQSSARESTAGDAHLSEARSIHVGEQQSEQSTERKVPSHGSVSLRDGIHEATVVGGETGVTAGPAHDPDGIQLNISLDIPALPEATCADRPTTVSFCEEGVLGSKPIHPDHPLWDGCMNRHTEPSSAPTGTKPELVNSSPAKTFENFCGQLAASIRKAKGLHLLDLSNNSIDQTNIDILFLAWSSCPRGGSSSSDHEQHVDSTVLHFFVKGRPCPCADQRCCASSH